MTLGESEGGDGSVKVWTSKTKGEGNEITLSPSPTWTPETTPPKLYLEGYAASSISRDVMLVLNYAGHGQTVSDTVNVTVLNDDLDVDSDNNNGYGDPDRLPPEDLVEDVLGDPERPGKVVVPNNDDSDEDGIPDYADGFNRDGTEDNDDDASTSDHFFPMFLEVPDALDLDHALLTLAYSESPPTDVGGPPDFVLNPGTGKLRIWKSPASDERNKNSIKAGGDYVPADAYTAAQLGLVKGQGGQPDVRKVRLYVEPIQASEGVGDLRITLTTDPDGDAGPAPAQEMDAVRFTVVRLDLDASPNSNEATEETPGTPVLLNDDWDCEEEYGASPPGDHREKEPIWDKDYTTAEVENEDDLMEVGVIVRPLALAENVVLKLPSGGESIRLWPRQTKGTEEEIITVPPGGRAVSELPLSVWVEGCTACCHAEMTLEYTAGTASFSDKLNIDVVMLEVKQYVVQQRVINDFDTDTKFEVRPDDQAMEEYTYLWDLDGEGRPGSGGWENATTREMTVRYNGNASGADQDGRNIQLIENAANRCKDYEVYVRVTAPGDPNVGLQIDKVIHVALASYQGTAVATTLEGRRAEVAGLADLPTGFSDTPPTGDYSQAWFENEYGLAATPTINDGNRLQYATKQNVFGLTKTNGQFPGLETYVMMIGTRAYDVEQVKYEDLCSIAAHECGHVQTDAAVNTPGTDWNTIVTQYGHRTEQTRPFDELPSYAAEWPLALAENGGSWYYLDQFTLTSFWGDYTDAMTQYDGIYTGEGGPPKEAARRILQQAYETVPFLEMKRNDCQDYVEPPL